MSSQRTHYITATDGVTIGGTVHGQGPSLVFLQGGMGDGDADWNRLIDHLADRFTCHLPSMRGRGLSSDHPDLSPARRTEDVLTYIDSITQPTGLVGWSAGANTALAVAAQSDAVNAVAPFEPGILSLMDEPGKAMVGETIAQTAGMAADGRLTDALRTFAAFPFNDEEVAMADEAGYFETAGVYVTKLLDLLQQEMQYEGPTADDPIVLRAISVPVLLLLGSDTRPFFAASAQYVADHVPNARVREISGAGHAAPLTHAEALAEALTDFFAAAELRS